MPAATVIIASAPPAEVVTEQVVAEVFEIASRVVPDPVTGTPMVVPIGAHAASRAASSGVVVATPR